LAERVSRVWRRPTAGDEFEQPVHGLSARFSSSFFSRSSSVTWANSCLIFAAVFS